MTLERAKYILNKKIDFIKENWENENTFDYYWTEEDIEAIEIIFIALENDKNAFIKQVEKRQEASSLYEKEKEKNIELEKEIRENYVSREVIIETAKKYDWALNGYDCDEADYKQSQAIGAWNALMIVLGR